MPLTFAGKRVPGGVTPKYGLPTKDEGLLAGRLQAVLDYWASVFDPNQVAQAIASVDPQLLTQALEQLNTEQLSSYVGDLLERMFLDSSSEEVRRIMRSTKRVRPPSRADFGNRVSEGGFIIPGTGFDVSARPERMFTSVSEQATWYAQNRAAQLIRDLKTSTDLSVRQIIAEAFTGPTTVELTAEKLRKVIGLHPRWARAVLRFDARTFERLMREGMDSAQARRVADRMTNEYRDLMIERRSWMIARTEIQLAQNFGRQASWVASYEAGLVDPAALKEWVTAPLAKSPCDKCIEVRGTRVPWNGTFANGYVMPPAHPHCRCTAVLVPPSRGLTGLPSQSADMTEWIDRFNALEAQYLTSRNG